jgi:TDG/mug DNA glycosylase family protein
MSVLPDVLAPGLTAVFCGTAVSAVSARRRAYYAGPGNAFWPTLFSVGLTPRLLAPEEYGILPQFGLGLTDLAKTVSGADRILTREDFAPDALIDKIEQHRPKVLAFTSKRAAEEFRGGVVTYGLLTERIGGTRLFVLPSPSGAARGYWDLAPWCELASLCRILEADRDGPGKGSSPGPLEPGPIKS